MLDKRNVKRIIFEKMKHNPNYLNEQIEAYDTEYALQKTLSIEFFTEDKLELVYELRDYLIQLRNSLSVQETSK